MSDPTFPQAPHINSRLSQSTSIARTGNENSTFSSHFHMQRSSSSHLGSQHTMRPSEPLPSRTMGHQVIQHPNTHSGAPQSQNQAHRRMASRLVTGVPIPPTQLSARDVRRLPDIGGTIPISSARPNHDMSGVVHGGHEPIPPRQGPVDELFRPFNHISGSQHDFRAFGFRPTVNGVHPGPVALEDRAMPQSQMHVQHGPSPSTLPAPRRQQSWSGATQGHPIGTGILHPEPRRSVPPPNGFAFQAANEHAATILNNTYSSLSVFYETQKSALRDELLRLNAGHLQTANQAQEACRRALRAERAEQEAKEKHEAAVRASESIVSKAMEWKESLEDSRRKHAIVQQQNAKLAQIALRLNKVVATDPSAALIAALKDRVTYLETRLRQYEDVPPSIEAKSAALGNGFDYVSDSSTFSSQGTSVPSDTDATKASQTSRSDADKQRQRIVAELFESRLKPNAPEETHETKEEPLEKEEQERLLNAPYVIDLTIDDQASIPSESLSRTSKAPVSYDLSESTVNPVLPSEPENRSLIHSDSVPCENVPSSSSVDSLKRNLKSEDDTDDEGHLRKRVRHSSSTPSSAVPPGVSKEPDNAPRMQEKTGISDTQSSSVIYTEDSMDGSVNGVPTEKDDETSSARHESGTGPSRKPDPPLQIDSVHLQLIYHRSESGDRTCRFCVMEIDHGIRTDEATVFPATAQNDELIEHAVSAHCPTVSQLLQMEKGEILTAFVRIMEVE